MFACAGKFDAEQYNNGETSYCDYISGKPLKSELAKSARKEGISTIVHKRVVLPKLMEQDCSARLAIFSMMLKYESQYFPELNHISSYVNIPHHLSSHVGKQDILVM